KHAGMHKDRASRSNSCLLEQIVSRHDFRALEAWKAHGPILARRAREGIPLAGASGWYPVTLRSTSNRILVPFARASCLLLHYLTVERRGSRCVVQGRSR